MIMNDKQKSGRLMGSPSGGGFRVDALGNNPADAVHDQHNRESAGMAKTGRGSEGAQVQRSSISRFPTGEAGQVCLKSSKALTKKSSCTASVLPLRRQVTLLQLYFVIIFGLFLAYSNASESSNSGWLKHLSMTQMSDVVAHIDDRTPECLLCPDAELYYVDC